MFYTLSQNNSGGYFIQDDNVDVYVIIEASTERQFEALATDILRDYREYCSCCGERWDDDWVSEKDATEVPTVYGTPVDQYSYWWENAHAIIYYLDGRKEKVLLTCKR